MTDTLFDAIDELAGHGESQYVSVKAVKYLIRNHAAKPMNDGWRTIDSAPKDGTHFIVFRPAAKPNRRVREDYYMQDARWKGILGRSMKNELPTHWMPIPNPPEQLCNISVKG